MRVKLCFPIVGAMLALVCAVVASANSVSVQEADLTAYGMAYEINRGPGGALYVSDYGANEIWHIDASGAYTVYQVFETVLDARPNSAGDLWFTDGATTFGRVAVPTGTVTTWQVPELHNLWGLTFAQAGRVWMTDFVGEALYRFDPSASELCTYTLPTSSRSYYILHDQGQLWLRNWDLYRIYQIDVASNQVNWWQWELGPSNAEPAGLALDGGGNLWWADPGLGALARLEPDLDQLTTYVLPVGTVPRMLEIGRRGVWYTEAVSGTAGLLDPASAVGITTTLARGSGTVSTECSPWNAGTTASAVISTGTLSWAPGTVTSLTDGGGWNVYELATDARPYGVARSGGYLWAIDQGRQKLMRLPVSVPSVGIDKHTNGQDADGPPGPTVIVDAPVTWTYRVENTGDVDLTDVTVMDDNGTPADDSDDYICVIGTLAVGAVDDTSCSQSGTAVVGQYVNMGTVTANAGAIQVRDSDSSHYLGEEDTVFVFLPLVLKRVTE
jgi:streptogramin lyase